jgi:hypothetical protein
MHQIGDDFNYRNSEINFLNWDKLINYINNNQDKFNISLKYGTPSDYIKKIHSFNLNYSISNSDYFPY